MCLLAMLGSQGIVVKWTAAIFFRTVEFYVNITTNLNSLWLTGLYAGIKSFGWKI